MSTRIFKVDYQNKMLPNIIHLKITVLYLFLWRQSWIFSIWSSVSHDPSEIII